MVSITLSSAGLLVNSQAIPIPGTPIAALTKAIGKEPRVTRLKHSDVFAYDAEGVFAHCERKTDQVHTFAAMFEDVHHFPFRPTSLFVGALEWEGQPFGGQDRARLLAHARKEAKRQKVKGKSKSSIALAVGGLSVYVELDETKQGVASIEISRADTDEKANLPPIVPPTGEGVVFRDFNFKLAVIQALMYERTVLAPRFDVYEFVKRYKMRTIDVSDEGYEVIPEVRDFFARYPITAEMLQDVDALVQDGGQDIYLQVRPLWDGEDDQFNIRSAEDSSLLPNLKRVVLFYDDDSSVLAAFKKKKIAARFL